MKRRGYGSSSKRWGREGEVEEEAESRGRGEKWSKRREGEEKERWMEGGGKEEDKKGQRREEEGSG